MDYCVEEYELEDFAEEVRGIAFRELNWTDARRRYVSLGQIVAFVRSQFKLLDGCYVGGLAEVTEILEFIASVVRSGYLAELAGNDDVECAWDDDTNQMTWWIDMKGVRYP